MNIGKWLTFSVRRRAFARMAVAAMVADLPMHHRDPFDRLLIAQARSEQLTIVTADRRITDYDVAVVDAG